MTSTAVFDDVANAADYQNRIYLPCADLHFRAAISKIIPLFR